MIRGIVKTCSPDDTAKVFGSFDFNARMIEKVFGVCIRNRSEEDGSDAIEITGEDTDTVAAVAGGLAGALYGYDSIPKEWRDTLIKRDYIEELCKTACNNWLK